MIKADALAALDEATLRQALADGLAHWGRATGTPITAVMQADVTTHQIATLRRRLPAAPPSVLRVLIAERDYPDANSDGRGAPDPNTPLRMHLALKMLRAWGMGQDFHGGVVATVRNWIDGGKSGPIPWPGGPFFEAWAEKEGLANVDGFVGLRFTVRLTP